MSDDLEKRVKQFQCFELPGQTMSMHMGTSYLVNDLWKEIERLRTALDKLPSRMTPDEEDGEPDYYADGWNDCLDAMLAIRERSNERHR